MELPQPPIAERFTAVVLAGIRAAGDPLAEAHGVPRKALIEIGGQLMLSRVLAALRASPSVGGIAICGADRATLEAGGLSAAELDGVRWLEAAAQPSTSVAAALESLGAERPVLVTTADHALLTASIVDEFCMSAAAVACDVAAAVVDAETVRAAYPEALRTFYPLRDGAFTGCNLFAFFGPGGVRAAEAWKDVDARRKQPWRVVALLGPLTLLRFALRRLTAQDAADILSRRLGIRIRIVRMTAPEAGIDVDKPADVTLVERILAARVG